MSTNASIITVGGTPPANQSVSGTVVATQLAGSILAVSATAAANQSVSGTVHVDNFSSVIALQTAGSVMAVSGSFSPSGNQSISGTVGASIVGQLPAGVAMLGSVAAFQGNTPWFVASSIAGGIFPISGSVAAVITNSPTVVVNNGSVVAFQGTNPWTVVSSLAGGIFPIAGSVAAIRTGQSGTVMSSIVNTIPSSVQVGASIMGTAPVTQVTSPWLVASSIAGGIFPISGSVAAVVTNNVTVVSSIAGGIFPISGSVAAVVTNTVTVVSSIAGGIFPVSGSVSAVITNNPTVLQLAGSILATSTTVNTTNSSVMLLNSANVIGSVTALQGTNPWIVNFANSSIIAINAGSVVAVIPGSVITLNQGSSILAVPVGSVQTVWLSPSIVGSYAEDAAHTSADKGLFTLNVRNDTLSSVTSNDGDYGALSVGPAGEGIFANSPITKWVYGTTSIVTGASVALIAAGGASIFTYVTGLNIVNPGGTNIYGNLSTGAGAASVLAYFTAPANGGSNMVFPNPLRSRDNTAILASISGVGSVYLSAQGFISKT